MEVNCQQGLTTWTILSACKPTATKPRIISIVFAGLAAIIVTVPKRS